MESNNTRVRKFRRRITILLLLLTSFLGIASPTLKSQAPSWIKVGDFAEYEASGVTWLLVMNTTSETGELVRNNESRLILLNQSLNAKFRWICRSTTDEQINFNFSLYLPLPIGNVSGSLLIDKATREMIVDDEAKGKTPFWISPFPSSGEEVRIGMTPGVLIGTASSIGSAIETIQGYQLHAYVRPETGGALLDYDWDSGLLLSIALIPVSNPSPNQVEMCFEPFYSLGFHGCNRRFKLKATNINLGLPVLDPISVSSTIQIGLFLIIFGIICGSLTFIHYRSQRRQKKKRRIKKKKKY